MLQLAEIIKAVMPILKPFFDFLAWVLQTVLKPVLDTILWIINTITSAIDAIGAFFKPVADFFGGIFQGVGDFFGGLFGFAGGTDFAPGGMAVVGENGPEIVSLPQGSQVKPTHETERGTTGNSQGLVINFNSPKQLSPVESGEIMRASMRRLAFEGVL
jgi:phage-related protein